MSQPLYLAFIWHMHQPYYRNVVTGECSMPWVRLHATKDYVDMVTRLESFPTIHQTVNVVPSLLDQLQEYLPPNNHTDAFLELSKKPAAELTDRERYFVLQWFFLANIERMVKPYPRYHDLLAKRGVHFNEHDWSRIHKRFHVQDYRDLQVWFNLAWIDPWLRSQNPQLAALERKGSHFTEEDKGYILEQHLALVARVIPTYRDAAARGQIELTTSPYYHPIMPLLCESRAAHVALPHLPLPTSPFRHPEDARWHLQQGLLRHQQAFGIAPQGMWPPEGSVSEEVAKLAMESKLQWMATDEEILWRTLKCPRSASLLYRPHLLRRKSGTLAIVFRDRELSDRVGFVYSQWEPRVAVADFLNRLTTLHEQFRTSPTPALISIILDGENAWEYYANDGHEFLTTLYGALATDERFRCVTVSEFLQHYSMEHHESLPELFSGSWIDGNFSTWIGHPEKNIAWTYLAAARDALASLSREDPKGAQAWKSLGIAEGSDWMWWFGDTHFSAQADEFDRLFRIHLANAYQLAGLEIPDVLKKPIRRQVSQPLAEPTGLIHPVIDGRETSYYEWLYAGKLNLTQQYSAIQRSEQCVQTLYYGFDETSQYVRLDFDRTRLARLRSWALELSLSGVSVRIEPKDETIHAQVLLPTPTTLSCAFDRILELVIPKSLLPLNQGEKLQLILSLTQAGELLERYPAQGAFALTTSVTDLEAQAWAV